MSEEVKEKIEKIEKDDMKSKNDSVSNEKLSEEVTPKKTKLPTAADLLADEVVEPIKKKRGSKNVSVGIAFVKTTFNNTIVSFTDMKVMLYLG